MYNCTLKGRTKNQFAPNKKDWRPKVQEFSVVKVTDKTKKKCCHKCLTNTAIRRLDNKNIIIKYIPLLLFITLIIIKRHTKSLLVCDDV